MTSAHESEGDALAQRVCAHLHALDSSGPTRGMEPIECRMGLVRVRMLVTREMLNSHAIAHGGIVFALADTSLAYAAMSRNRMAVTRQATMEFLSPARDGETLIAEARELTLSERGGVYIVTVRSADGRVIALVHGLTRTTGEPVLPPSEE